MCASARPGCLERSGQCEEDDSHLDVGYGGVGGRDGGGERGWDLVEERL